jgi:anti-sigma factor RsiW
MAQWTASGMEYWAVSDLARDELRAFAAQFRQRNQAQEGAVPP